MLVFTLLITWLTALFGATSAPVRVLLALGVRARVRFAGVAERWCARGHALAYEGEDAKTVARRLERLAWIARDPLKALRHMTRLTRGLLRARLGGAVAPPDFAPPMLRIPELGAGAEALTRIPDS